MKKGDKVKYIGCSKEQIEWGGNDSPVGILTEGYIYFIDRVEVHNMHTKVFLSGVKGKFNSVCFKNLEKGNDYE